MTLSSSDINSLIEAFKPEFDKVKSEIQASLKPEFDKLNEQAKQNFNTLNKKIESLKRSNRKDHNTIINAFDKRDLKLQERVAALEAKSQLATFKSI